jgi:hypothetical protein
MTRDTLLDQMQTNTLDWAGVAAAYTVIEDAREERHRKAGTLAVYNRMLKYEHDQLIKEIKADHMKTLGQKP